MDARGRAIGRTGHGGYAFHFRNVFIQTGRFAERVGKIRRFRKSAIFNAGDRRNFSAQAFDDSFVGLRLGRRSCGR